MSEEAKQKISVAMREKHGKHWLGKKHSSETKQKMRENHGKYWLGKKHSPETIQKMRDVKKGENNPNWRGGSSFEPYCVKFNNEFKERVRNFFGRKCVECGIDECDNDVRLHVHHVNFRKDSCCSTAVIPLFVTLCTSCHSKSNYNREYWEDRFTRLINEKYGGQCYLPKGYI